MYSGKSTALFQRLEKLLYAKKKVLLIRPKKDDRGYFTHSNGIEIDNLLEKFSETFKIVYWKKCPQSEKIYFNLEECDAVFVDEVLANYYIATNNKNYNQIEQALEEEQYAIGFRKQDNELCNRVNEILKEIKEDGTLEAISKKWFGKDVTTIKGE